MGNQSSHQNALIKKASGAPEAFLILVSLDGQSLASRKALISPNSLRIKTSLRLTGYLVSVGGSFSWESALPLETII
jgi:hypothetical protein